MTIVVLGIWVIILPHLGVPGSWDAVITTITGIVIVIAGLYLRASVLSRRARTPHQPFVENAAPDMHEPRRDDHRQDIHPV